MALDNFPAIQLGGRFIDLDGIHSVCDSGTISNVASGSIVVTAGTITSVLGGSITVDNAELVTIDYSHEKAHDGEMYHAGYYAGTLAAEGTLLLSIAVGTVSPHLLWDISAGGNAEVRLTEGGTITGGTAVTVYNMDRNNAGSGLSTVAHSGALTGGTAFYNVMIPGGDGPKPTGGQGRGGAEWILMTGKTTIVEIVNIASAYPVSVGCTFYEENE
jgi:hypothetical protein